MTMYIKHFALTIDDPEFPLWVAAIDAGSSELKLITLNNSTRSNLLVAFRMTFADLDESVGPVDPEETAFVMTHDLWSVLGCWKIHHIMMMSYECYGVSNHWQLDYLFISMSRQTTWSALLALCEGKAQVDLPDEGPVIKK